MRKLALALAVAAMVGVSAAAENISFAPPTSWTGEDILEPLDPGKIYLPITEELFGPFYFNLMARDWRRRMRACLLMANHRPPPYRKGASQ